VTPPQHQIVRLKLICNVCDCGGLLYYCFGHLFVANDVSRGSYMGVAPRSLPSLLEEVMLVETFSLLNVSNSLSISIAHVEELS